MSPAGHVLSVALCLVAASGVPRGGSHANGIVLLQRQVEALPEDAEEPAVTKTQPVEVMGMMGEHVKELDEQLQRQASRHSHHIASTVAELDAKLKTEQATIAAIKAVNKNTEKLIEAQQNRNAGFRKVLNATKQRAERVARNYDAFSANLSRAASDLDVILQEDVEKMFAHAAPHESFLNIDANPDLAMDHLKESLKDMHLELEVEVKNEFNKNYGDLLAQEQVLTQRQLSLNGTLREERQRGAALQAEIKRLQKLLGDVSESDNVLQSSAPDVADRVLRAKQESAKREQLEVARVAERNAAAEAADASPTTSGRQNRSEHGDNEPTHKKNASTQETQHGLIHRAKAAVASAGAKFAAGVHGIFGGSQHDAAPSRAKSSSKSSTSPSKASIASAKHHVNSTHATKASRVAKPVQSKAAHIQSKEHVKPVPAAKGGK